MLRIYCCLILASCMQFFTPAMAQENCISANFDDLSTGGWTLFNGSALSPYNVPSNCQPNGGGIITPGVGGNNPTKILSPDITSNGSGQLRLQMDVYRLNSNLNCNTWSDYTCPTSITLNLLVGNSTILALSAIQLPQNGPSFSPTVNVNVNVQNQLPAGTVFKVEIGFVRKTRSNSCIQNNTKYIIDNLSICQTDGNTTLVDAIDDNYCPYATTNNIVTGNLRTNDILPGSGNYTYTLVNGPYGGGNLTPGGANLVVNSDGTFTLTRTDITLSIFDFTYRVTDPVTGNSDIASCLICIDDAGPVPVNLQSFTAIRKNNIVATSWITSMENSLKAFDVERKIDGKFVSIGTVTPQNSTNGAVYVFNENNYTENISEYRLRITEDNGQIKYSRIQSVSGINGKSSMRVYPNPSKGSATITVTDVKGKMSVDILDYTGKTIKSLRNLNDNSVTINGLTSGLYMVRAKDMTSGTIYVQQLVVEQ